MIVDPEVGVLTSSVAFDLLYAGKTQNARMNIHLYIVWSAVYYPLLPFWVQHSCKTYHKGYISLLRVTL